MGVTGVEKSEIYLVGLSHMRVAIPGDTHCTSQGRDVDSTESWLPSTEGGLAGSFTLISKGSKSFSYHYIYVMPHSTA